MANKMDDFAVDIRALKLNINRGKLTQKEYENHLKSLPDLSKDMSEIPGYFEEEEELIDIDIDTESSGDLTFSVV
jgi:hypothetical protein